jgi:hypothetical protein
LPVPPHRGGRVRAENLKPIDRAAFDLAIANATGHGSKYD